MSNKNDLFTPQYKPATLHVETDSLINTSNCTRSTGGKEDSLLSPTFQQVGGRTLVTLEEASDEVSHNSQKYTRNA